MKCECNYHLGMGPNLLCPIHGKKKEAKMKLLLQVTLTDEQIQKIRQLLKPILEIQCHPIPRRFGYGGDSCEIMDVDLLLIEINTKKVLTLLPCETCGGTGRVIDEVLDDVQQESYIDKIPCPDCQPCPRCGGINGKHKQVDDPQAGNSHMLTKMQCPNDPKNPTYY